MRRPSTFWSNSRERLAARVRRRCEPTRADRDPSDVLPLLPGFGAPRPDGFRSTKEEYVDWLIARLERVGEPVDLVGHDWGCILTARVASLRPDLVRTWAGGNGPVDAAYTWHPPAKVWQHPADGDRFMCELRPGAFAAAVEAHWRAGPGPGR